MNMTTTLAAALLLTGQAADAPSRPGVAHLRHCVVSVIEDVRLPAEQDGVIIDIAVKEGNSVKTGDILAQIDDSEAKIRWESAHHELLVAQEKANDEVSIAAAQEAEKVAIAEYEESQEINRRAPGAVPPTQLRRELLTAKRAGLQIQVAELEKKIAGMETEVSKVRLKAAQLDIDRRKIDSPLDGVVVQMTRHEGEWVKAGEPIMYVVKMSQLRVEGFVDANEFAPAQVFGKPVTIRVMLAHDQVKTVTGTIDYYNPLVEASGEFRVWAEVDNELVNGHWVLNPGMQAEMEIDVNAIAPARTAAR